MSRADARGNPRDNHWAAKPHHIYKPGEMVAGRYGVMRELASGGMAEVYEVVDSQIGELRALKTTNARYTDSPKIVDRMILEFKALRKMSHPNLVRVYDAGIDEGQPYYVMELLQGHALTDLAHGRCLSPGVALSLIRQVAEGVHALHEMGTVHRDLKPDNIFVLEASATPDSAEHGCKVLDLGVAKHADSSTTSSNIALGTVTYMAPEQTVGQRVDARTDVYALALILYELLAGTHPLQGKSWPRSAQEWAQRQRDMEPPTLADLDIGVHPVLSNLVQRAMAKKPAARFATAAELAHQIRAATVMLRELGQLGPTRIEPFRPKDHTAQIESGPQPIARVRPPNTPEPSAGLAFRRTDEPEVIEPIQVRAEPPRVSARPDQLAERGTVKMLGQKGTVPLLEAPKMMVPSEPAPLPPAPAVPPPTPAPAPARSENKPNWREVPRDQDLAAARRERRAEKIPQPKWQRQLFAEEPSPLGKAGGSKSPQKNDEDAWPPLAWWLKAVALGLAISLVIVAVAVVVQRLRAPAARPFGLSPPPARLGS